MTVKTKKLLTVILCVIAAVTCSTVGIVLFRAGATGDASISSAAVKEYNVGEKITLPSRELSDGGVVVSVDPIVIYPSGNAVKKNTVTLSEAGIYTVEYRAEINGKTIIERETFKVYSTLYSFSGEKSSAYYGPDDSQYETGKTALNVSLAQGEKITFNQIIDLNNVKGNFVEFYVTPKTRGVPDVQGAYFTLTDVYDSSNKVTFQLKNVAYLSADYVYKGAYVTAGFGSYLPRAWAYDSTDKVWRLRINDKFGTLTNLSLYGWAEDYGGVAIRDTYCGFSVDLSTKKVFLSDSSKLNQEIIDFDDPAFFDTPWAGFTTGEAILSVEAYDYTSSYFNINFTSVAGYDFASGARVVDEEAPIITIDTGVYDADDLPNGYAGYTYPVFPSSAYDKVDGNTEVTVRAFYEYDSDIATELNFSDVVSTKREGRYRLIYTAMDAFRNVAKKELSFYVQQNPNPITVDFVGTYETAAKVGEKISLAGVEVSGGSGTVKTEFRTDKKCDIDLKKNTIRPLETGVLTVTCVATDITGYSVDNYSYTINVSANPDPVVLEHVILPQYLLGGLKYTFAKAIAHDFNTGSDTEAEVWIDGVKYNGGIYTPEDKQNIVGGVDTLADPYDVSLEYKVGGTTVLSETIPVIDIKTVEGPLKVIHVEGYWADSDFVKTANDKGILFSCVSAAESDLGATFAKPILYESFSLGFNLKNSAKVNDFTITLTDYSNFDNTLKIGLRRTADRTMLVINDEETGYPVSVGGYHSLDNCNISISDGKIKDGGSLNYDVSDIFSAEKVYISIAAENVELGDDISFTVTQVGGVRLTSTTTSDLIAPIVKLDGTYAQFADKGSVLTIYPVIAEDLLDTEINAKVKVTLKKNDGSSEVLLANGNALTTNTVTVSDYGKLEIQYIVSDGSGNERKPKYTVGVANLVEPEIKFDGKVSAEYKVGKTIKFDEATATDNTGKAIAVKYYVITPSMHTTPLSAEREFTPDCVGTYIFRIYAMDGMGNISYKDITFKVVK